MNLYLRLLWTIVSRWRAQPIKIGETIQRTFRVLPNDLDINAHMNNGRYVNIVELLVVEYFIRCGFARVLLRNKWRPVVGGSIVHYRRPLAPFATYVVSLTAEASDQYWNYLRFEFTRDGRVCATGYLKGATVSRQGLVETARTFESLGGVASSVLPDGVKAWKDAEERMRAG